MWSDYADYLVASTEVESGDGWNYSFLATLNQTKDTLTVAESILESYMNYYDTLNLLYGAVGIFGQIDATLSCIDLGKLDKVVSTFDELSQSMKDDIKNGNYPEIARIRSGLKAYAQSSAAAYDIVDMGDLAIQMSQLYYEEASELADALDRAIVLSGANVDSSYGLSVYFPYYDAAGIFSDDNLAYLGCSERYMSQHCPAGYAEFLDVFTVNRFGGSTTRSSLLTAVQEESNVIKMELTEEQINRLSKATYTIMKECGEGVYTPVKQNCPVEPDQSGTIQIDANQEVICASNGYDRSVWAVEYVDENRFTTIKTRAYGSLMNVSSGTTMDRDVNVNLFVDEENSGVIIESMNEQTDDVFADGRKALQVEDWNNIGYIFKRYMPTENASQEMQPYSLWEDDGWTMIAYIALDSALKYEYIPVSELEGNYVCQIVLEDIYGEQYASEIYEISSSGRKTTVEYNTEEGVLTFEIFGEEASLISYEGTDEVLEIPETIEDATVTAVMAETFSFDTESRLETVILPDTVEYIQSAAFDYCSTLKEIVLPASLGHIEAGAIYDCRSLEKISISEENENYMTVDDVLFTKDGRTLINYPAGKYGEYEVPDNVEIIEAFAFCGSTGLKKITFREGLREIDDYAFYNCTSYDELVFPDSLKRIGQFAFGVSMDWMFYNELLPDEEKALASIEIICLGSNIRSVGHGAFCGIANQSFSVDEGNRYYTAVDGLLTNAAGDSLVAVPMGISGSVEIPNQITAILTGSVPVGINAAFTEIVLPDTVISIQKKAFLTAYGDLTLICEAGSYAETYAKNNELTYAAR